MRTAAIAAGAAALSLYLLVTPAALAQAVQPTPVQERTLKALEGAYLSSHGNTVILEPTVPGAVRAVSANMHSPATEPGLREAVMVQVNADGVLRGSFGFRDPTTRTDIGGIAQVDWPGAGRVLTGWLSRRPGDPDAIAWTLCPRPAANMRFAGDGVWVGFSKAAYQGSLTSADLTLLLAAASRELSTSRFTLRLDDADRSVIAKGYADASTGQTETRMLAERCAPAAVRFIFDAQPPPTGGPRKFVLVMNGKDVASWDAEAARPSSPTPGPAPAPDFDPIEQGSPAPAPSQPWPSPTGPAPGGGAFKEIAKWDVRLDRVTMPRDDKLVHVYLTFRNATKGVLWQTQGVQVRMEDSDGVTSQNGQSLRAAEGYPQLFSSPPAVDPGKEIRVKFVFSREEGATPRKVVVMEGTDRAEFNVDAVSR